MPPTTRLHLPRLIALLLLATAFLSGCGEDEADDGARRFEADAPGSAESTEPGDESAAKGADALAASGGEPSKAGDGEAGVEKKPRPKGAPLEGRFTYKFTSVRSGKTSERLFDVVDGRGSPDGEFRQFLTWSVGDEATRHLVIQDAEGSTVEAEQRARGPQVAALCTWEPPYLDTPRDAQVGRRWSIDTKCENDGAKRRRTVEASVRAVENASVDGQTFRVLVISRKITTTTSGSGLEVSEVEELTDRYAPDLGLIISQEGTRAATVQGVPRTGSPFRLDLVSLKAEKVPYDVD